ncbi:Hypothetical protein NTJ_13713 [Nesidiocoris tenuis]|nr:Hypothetical protein NTJ_13713 [Nesidiocoris tenuis]
MLFISSLKPCEEGPRFDELGTRVAYRGGCHSVQIYLTTRNKKTKEIGYDMEKINFPVLGEVQPAVGELVFNLSWSLEFLAYWHLDGKPVETPAHFDKDSVEKSPFLIWFANFDKPFPPDYLYQYKYLKPNISKPSSSTSTTSATPTADKLNLVSQHGTTITVLLCFSSVAIVVASASYIHFLWIQCPSKHRVLILAAFFSLNFLGSWLTAFCLSGLQTTQLVVQLSFQVFGCVWHLGSAIIFWRKLRQLRDDEKKNIKNMLF